VPADIRLVQLSRILGQAVEDAVAARTLTARHTGTLARAFVEEAAANDDVVSVAGARGYLDDRLAFFGDLLEEAAKDAVRTAFEAGVSRWDS
jgi:hypothetical protein